MAKFDNEEGAKPKRGGAFRNLARFVTVLLVIAVILFITLCLAVKTDGGRSFIEDSLRKRLGLEMTIKEARIGFPPALIIEEPASKAIEPGGRPILKAQEISITRSFNGGWILTLERCALNLMRTTDNGWNPAFFSKLGDLPQRNIAEISRIMRRVGKHLTLHVSEGSVNWMESTGTVTAAASGIFLDVTPIEIPDRKMCHYHLSVYRSFGENGVPVNDIEREWLSSETKDYIEIERAGSPVSSEGMKFWEPVDADDGKRTTEDR